MQKQGGVETCFVPWRRRVGKPTLLVFLARRAEQSGVEAWAEQGGVEACFAAWRRRVMKPALLVFLAR